MKNFISKHKLFFLQENQRCIIKSYFKLLSYFAHASTMPKSREDTDKLRQMRIKASKQKSQIPPSEIYLCVLGNGAAGSPRSLYMFSDHSRYLFNCGEGTQRLAHEYKMKLSKLEHIFVTHNSWENLGGLLGLSLTIHDIGVPRLTLHGPQNIEDLYTFSKSFVMTKNLTVDKRHPDDLPFVDSCMEVHSVPIYGSSREYSRQTSSNGQSEDSDSSENHVEKKLRVSTPNVVAFICKCHNKKGQLILEKCIELGVPSGPLLGELKNGKDVTLPNGKIVRSSDVTSPEQPCPVFLVVECPSEKFLDSFVLEERLRASQDSTSPLAASLVVHFTPSSILHHEKYQEWMNGFPESTCHLILNEDCATANSNAIHRVQHMLNLIHPRVFNLLYEYEEKPNIIGNVDSSTILSRTMHRYHLRPNKAFDSDQQVRISPEAYVQEAKDTSGFEESLKSLQLRLDEGIDIENREEYPEVVFLGTGSCIPSKVRNVSCILLNISNDCSMFMDCGEGSYNQLLRLYGAEATEEVLRKVTCIFISHIHADHHLGLFTLLKQRIAAFATANQEPSLVTIIAPACISDWLQSYSNRFEPMSSFYRFVDCYMLQESNGCYIDVDFEDADFEEVDARSEVVNIFNDVEVLTVPVRHCPNAYGLVLKSVNNWKIVYSGDTTPCQRLVDAGKDCTLLIHEATMEDDLEDEAAIKMHSTTSQAIDIAEKMRAKYTLLTHFSQRYAKVPLFSDRFHSRVGCAFDNMRVRMCDLPIVSLFIPTLQILFAENVEKLIDKGIKRKEKLKQLVKEIKI